MLSPLRFGLPRMRKLRSWIYRPNGYRKSVEVRLVLPSPPFSYSPSDIPSSSSLPFLKFNHGSGERGKLTTILGNKKRGGWTFTSTDLKPSLRSTANFSFEVSLHRNTHSAPDSTLLWNFFLIGIKVPIWQSVVYVFLRQFSHINIYLAYTLYSITLDFGIKGSTT